MDKTSPICTKQCVPSYYCGPDVTPQGCGAEQSKNNKIRVEAYVDGVTTDGVDVSFYDKIEGWYGLHIPSTNFSEVLEIGSVIVLDVYFESGKGITGFDVPSGQNPKRQNTRRRQCELPPEPTDYDDPNQVRDYEERLRRYFHFH